VHGVTGVLGPLHDGWSPPSSSPPASSDARSLPCDSQTYNLLKVRISATMGEEPEVEVELGTGQALMPESQTGRLSPTQDCE
jgi:hypothetical protein